MKECLSKTNANGANKPPFKDPYIWIVIAMLLFLIICVPYVIKAQTTQVNYDTIVCNVEYIDEFVEIPTSTGKSVKRYAVYNDKYNDISDIISVSKTVYDYIQTCKQHNIKPSLAIKLKDGVIVSIIRYKPKYIRRKK